MDERFQIKNKTAIKDLSRLYRNDTRMTGRWRAQLWWQGEKHVSEHIYITNLILNPIIKMVSYRFC
jgi:hypothetical protein